MIVHGIEYTKPTVILLQETGIGAAEIAARTCYDSFENSEHEAINFFPLATNTATDETINGLVDEINEIEHSELLDTLAWTYFHHSILEHANLSYLVKGTSRGVLQEHARHRIQGISVRSTRYTMSGVINAFLAAIMIDDISRPTAKGHFNGLLASLDMFVIVDKAYIKMETDAIYDKLMYQMDILGKEEFFKLTMSKEGRENYENPVLFDMMSDIDSVFKGLQMSKKKRNVGDAFKHVVSDNWKVDMVVTFNIRSLKNYFELRDSGAAFFQIQWLAKAMKDVTPAKYLDLIVKAK